MNTPDNSCFNTNITLTYRYASSLRIKETTGSTTTYYSLLRDYLGNITHKVNTTGNVVAEYSYDSVLSENLAFVSDSEIKALVELIPISKAVREGCRRDKDTWNYTLSGEPDLLAGRAFTSHEYLPWFKLINMNGRLYDPLVGRFLSPDNFVQAPGLTQSFNRYSYALNNPLVYTDPDGEFIVPMLIGAGISIITNGLSNTVHGQKFFNGAGKAAIFGAIGGAASFGIGQAASALSSAGWSNLAVAGFQAGAHATTGGILSASQGGNFWHGFAAGGVASGLSSGVGALNLGAGGQIIAGGLGGGIGATIAGGDFFHGMGQGLITGGLNHAVHSGVFGKGLAIASITGRTRHLFGPDATSYSLSLNGSAGVNVGAEGGALVVHRGIDKGIHSIVDFSAGIGGVDVSLTGEFTDLYYSGRANSIKASQFYGGRTEVNISVGAIASIGLNFSFARVQNNNFVIGIGASFGVGASASIAAFNINTGVSARNATQAGMFIRKY